GAIKSFDDDTYRHKIKHILENKENAGNGTCLSHNHFGNVEIPEICEYSIDNQCQFEKTGCKRLHGKCPYYWQIEYDGTWANLKSFQSRELEDSFKDPANNECSITPFDIMELKANFKLMKIQNDSSIHTYKIRRLSTDSAAISNSSKATVYDWYFLDNNNAWAKYGYIDSTGNRMFLTSNDTELNFILYEKSLFKYKIEEFEYELDFSKMIQRNISTGKEREVRRRPQGKFLLTYDNANLQYESDISKNNNRYIHFLKKESEVRIYPYTNI
ncbi:unnamed protein product, partial [Meganyctiphanes norvegica]